MSSVLPPSWRWVTLDELLVEPLTNGRSVRTAVDGFPILRLTAIRDQRVDLTEWKTGAWTEQDAEPFLVRRGDFFIARGSGSRHLVGRGGLVREEPSRVAFPDKFIRARTSRDVVDPEYLALVWASPLVALQMHTLAKTTAGIHMVTQDDIRSCKLPLASLREQRQIVDVVDAHFSRLDAATATLEHVQRNLERYRASVLKAAVGGRLVPTEAELAKKEGRSYEPASALLKRILAERRRRWEEAELAKLTAKGKKPTDDKWKAKYEEPAAPDVSGLPELPEGWCWASVDQVTAGDRMSAYGVLVPGPDVTDGVLFVRVGDIDEGRIDQTGLKRIDRQVADQFSKTYLRGGEVLLTLVGTIGRAAVVPEALAGANVARAVGVIPPSALVSPSWLVTWLRSPMTHARMVGKSHEVARKTLNLEDVRTAPVALPPQAEHGRIVEVVSDLDSLAAAAEMTLRLGLQRITRLRQSILKWAFEGRLVEDKQGACAPDIDTHRR